MEFEQWLTQGFFGWLIFAVLLLGAAFVVAAWSWHRAAAQADRLWEKCRQNEAAEFERVIGEARK